MIRRLAWLLLLAMPVMAFAASPAPQCADCAEYAIVLRAGVDADEVMPALAAIAGTEARQDGSRVVMTTTASRARLLATDGRVA